MYLVQVQIYCVKGWENVFFVIPPAPRFHRGKFCYSTNTWPFFSFKFQIYLMLPLLLEQPCCCGGGAAALTGEEEDVSIHCVAAGPAYLQGEVHAT